MSIAARTVRVTLTALITAAAAAATVGCAGSGVPELHVSDRTKAQSATVICAASDLTISQLSVNSQGVRLAATLIRDNTDDSQVKSVAQAVIDNPADTAAIDALRGWVTTLCKG